MAPFHRLTGPARQERIDNLTVALDRVEKELGERSGRGARTATHDPAGIDCGSHEGRLPETAESARTNYGREEQGRAGKGRSTDHRP